MSTRFDTVTQIAIPEVVRSWTSRKSREVWGASNLKEIDKAYLWLHISDKNQDGDMLTEIA